ncbi:MAG: PAS domain S-box protein [Chloroflexota bacterium]
MDNSSQNPDSLEPLFKERQILDASPTGTLITRISDGTILFANRAIGKLLGTNDIASLVGTPVPNFYWDADERKVVLENFAAQGFLENYEMRARRLDGSMFWVAISLQPFHFEGEQVILSTILDITQRKQAEQQLLDSEQRMRALLTAIPQPVLVTSLADGTVLYANQQIADLTGIPFEQIVGRRTPDFYHDPADRLRFVEALQKDGCVRSAEIEIKRLDGSLVWVEINIEMTSYQGMPATVCILEDISERKRSESLLAQRIVTLTSPEEEIGNLRFEDLFDIDQIQAIQDAFAAATGVASIITDVDGKPITTPSNFCYLCEHIIRKTEKGLANCYHSDAVLGRLNPDGPILQPCLSGGLWDGGASIQVGDRHVANWLIGQVLDDTIDEEAMLSYGKEIGADDEEFRRALQDVTRMSREQFARVGQALFLIAGQLSNLAVQNVQQARHIAERKKLEEQIQQSLARRSEQLQMSTNVAQQIASATQLDELFRRIVDLTKEQFGYYHTQLLRYDASQEAIVLVVGYGETGQKMLAMGHKLLMGAGLIGTAAATGQTILRPDLAAGDPDWKPNPLLPETKGEIAIPIKWQDTVLGVLDVQSSQAGALTDEDRLLLEGLCGQIAIAIHNAELVEAVREGEQRYQQILDAITDMVLVKGPKSSIVWANRAFRDYYGMTNEQLRGLLDAPIVEPDYTLQYVKDDAYVFESGEVLQIAEEPVTRHDGIVRPFETVKSPIRDLDGNIVMTVGVSRDITERKQERERIEKLVEERTAQLNENQRLLQTVLDNFPGIVFWKTRESVYLGCNRAFALGAGLTSPVEIVGKSDYDLPWAKTEADAYRADDLAVMESGQARLHIVETQYQADGKVVWFDTSKVPLSDASGEIIGILGISSDVSDRMRAEEAMRASREQLFNIIDFLPDATFVIDKNRKVIAWNRAIEEMTGIPKDEIMGKGDYAYAAPFYGDARPILIDFALEPGQNVHERYDEVGWSESILAGEVYVPSVYGGRGAYLYATASPLYDADGNIIGAVEAIRDITERKKMEVSMQENEARFRALFEKSADAILLLEDGVFTDCNQATVEMMRAADKTQFLSLSPASLSPEYQPDRRLSSEKADEMIQTALKKGVHRFEWVHRRTDGSDFSAEVLLAPILLGERQVLYSVWRDITERKQAESQLQQEKTFSDTAINSLPGVFYMFGTDGKFVRWNANMEKVTGYSGEELARMVAIECFVEEDRALVLSRIQEVFTEGASSVEASMQTKDGDLVPYFLTGRQVLIDENPYLIGVGIDVTERKYLEARLQQTLQRRGYQVQLSTEIAQEVASASDLGALFEQVVTLIKERLGYYHAQILRYDPMQDTVALVAGYGEIGAQMLALNHRMPMGRGLIGLAAAQGETVLRPILEDDPNWQPNPLLPHTRGEIAVPIKLGEQVLGVLDVQSDQAGTLTEDDRLLLEGLCGQIAVAIEQTRLRSEMAERLDEINVLYRTMSREGWDTFRQTATLPPGFQFDQSGIRPLDGTVALDSQQLSTAPLAMPGGMSIGMLGLLDDPSRPLTREDRAFLQQVSEQVALALESARLFAQTQYTLGETETLYETSTRLNTATEYGEILDILRQNTLLGHDSQNVSMNVFDHPWTPSDMPEWIEVLARWSTLPASAVSDRYPLSAFPSARELLHSNAPTIIEDIVNDPRLDANARALYAQRYGAKSTIFVPLVVGGLWIGYFNAIYQQPARFPDSDVRRLVALSAQAAVVINNRRLFEETQSRANRERILREVTTRVRASVDADAILRTAVRELGDVLKRETFVQIGVPRAVSSAQSSDGGQSF